MSEAKHAPLPWSKQANIPYVNCGEAGCLLGPIALAGSMEEMNANAAFVVRACNSHAELVEALKLAKMYVETAADDDPADETSHDLGLINAALAKAEAA